MGTDQPDLSQPAILNMSEPTPSAFVCPITCEVMEEPVVTSDGQSYDRPAIQHWLQTHNTSPLTNAQLTSTALLSNIALRHAIEEWRARQPLAIDPDRLRINLDELLGQGSFGRVVGGVLSTHGRDQRVAVKMLPELTQAEQRVQFDTELKAHLTAQQGAEGVCRLIGTCQKGSNMCLVLKRYERNLADKIAAGELDYAEVRRIMWSLCRTLSQLHAAGVVVQDIKPQNVLLDQYDEPVFADFGIAGARYLDCRNR